jgi:hypothetical protein
MKAILKRYVLTYLLGLIVGFMLGGGCDTPARTMTPNDPSSATAGQ